MDNGYDPDDAFENGMWNSDAEPYAVQNVDYFEQDPYSGQNPQQAQAPRGGRHFSGTHMRGDSQPTNAYMREDPRTSNAYMREDPQPRKVRRWPWVIVGFLLVALVAVGIYGYFMYSSVKSMQSKAQSAMGQVDAFMGAVRNGDSASMQKSASEMSAVAHDVRNELQKPIWSIAAMLPTVGSDVNIVRSLGDVSVDMADNVLVPISSQSDVLKLSGLLSSGKVNVDALQSFVTALETAGPVLSRCSDQIEALPKANIPQVAALVDPLREKIIVADGLIDHINPLVPHLPFLLGANGQTRTYLVLAENTAEIHASGGFVGSLGTITVTDGNIEMGDFQGLNEFLNEENIGAGQYMVPAGATAEEIGLFGLDVDTHHGDHNLTPDFSRVGQMYFNANQTMNEQTVDGVIAFDPVFLQYMLRIVGGFETSFGVTVDGSNAAPIMLNECLFWWQPALCDEFYSEVSETAFQKILTGLGDASTNDFFATVMRSADEGRCIAWAADPTIEAAVQQAGFGWELSHDETKPVTGVYINDRSISKASYYLSVKTDMAPGVKNPDGSTSYDVTATFRHNMDRDLLYSGLPEYIQVNFNKSQAGANRSLADLYEAMFLVAPQGGRIDNPVVERLDSTSSPDTELTFSDSSYQGIPLKTGMMRIDAGETVIVRYTVTTSPNATEALKVRTTPVIPPEIAGW